MKSIFCVVLIYSFVFTNIISGKPVGENLIAPAILLLNTANTLLMRDLQFVTTGVLTPAAGAGLFAGTAALNTATNNVVTVVSNGDEHVDDLTGVVTTSGTNLLNAVGDVTATVVAAANDVVQPVVVAVLDAAHQ